MLFVYTPAGRPVFRDADRLESRPIVVRGSHCGFVYDHIDSPRTIDGEPQFDQ